MGQEKYMLSKFGADFFVSRDRSAFTCAKKTLTLSQNVEENDGSATVNKLSYRRTE